MKTVVALFLAIVCAVNGTSLVRSSGQSPFSVRIPDEDDLYPNFLEDLEEVLEPEQSNKEETDKQLDRSSGQSPFNVRLPDDSSIMNELFPNLSEVPLKEAPEEQSNKVETDEQPKLKRNWNKDAKPKVTIKKTITKTESEITIEYAEQRIGLTYDCHLRTPELINLEGKPVTQSGTYSYKYLAEYAIDGDTDTMQHTADGDRFPWWRVDLLKPYHIQRLEISARPGFEERFHCVRIVVSNEDINQTEKNTIFNPSNKSICVDNIASASPVGPKWSAFECEQTVIGRYVSIQITGGHSGGKNDCQILGHPLDSKYNRYLHMTEVKVFGHST